MNTISKFAFTASITASLALWMPPALSDPMLYEGTATLCFTGSLSPSVERDDAAGVTYVSNIVSLYYIQTAPVAADPAPAGLVNGWELLIAEMKSKTNMYWLKWTGVLIPAAYAGSAGTVLKEVASIETADLSTLSGTWRGAGELSGTSVDYVLTVDSDLPPTCPSEQPPQCAGIEGGCMQAQQPFVYRITGSVSGG
jgi:hypothetical protein